MDSGARECLGTVTGSLRRRGVLDPLQRCRKRGVDVVVGSLLLACSLPLMALIALAVRLVSPGPVILGQERVGQGQRPFKMLKFRTMAAGSERQQNGKVSYTRNGHMVHKRMNDPRITRVGRFLRRTSLDELPQLFNVVKGDMSLVGPRPELPWLAELYRPWWRQRFLVPQGLTGWWQVTGRGNKPVDRKIEDDLYYIEHYSLWLDLKILWKTIPAVIRGEGAF